MTQARRFLEHMDPLRDPVTAFCRRLLWSSADLEDALQEVFAVAYRDFSAADRRPFRPWIFRIATWTCFNFNRRHERRNTVETAHDRQVPELGAVDTLERECSYEEIIADPTVAFDGFQEELARACRLLTEKERAILLLKSLSGLTCAEIAEALELPLGTVQGLLTRARHKMRVELTGFARRRGLLSCRDPR